MAREQIEMLRRAMKKQGADLCYVPSDDPHGSEYPGDHFKVREYLSGFTGSAGVLVLSADWAGLWTDARYFIQAANELAGSGITLYRMGEPGVPPVMEEISERLPLNGVIAADPAIISCRTAQRLCDAAGKNKGSLAFADLAGMVWKERPDLPASDIITLDISVSGESRAFKLARIRDEMQKAGAGIHVLAGLEDIAWALNIRARDTACTPVALAYLVITMEKAIVYFRDGAWDAGTAKELGADGVEIHSYDAFYEELGPLTAGGRVLLDPDRVNKKIYDIAADQASIVSGTDPTVFMKAVKNSTEISGMKADHLKDGIAYTHFIYWLKERMSAGEHITEIDAADALHGFRTMQEGFWSESFETIAAYGKNGAIVHYTATKESNTALDRRGFLLVDAGAHYGRGTTDVTRTIALGPLTEQEKEHFTAVLKGMLALGAARFPAGTRGSQLDMFAREPLWELGLDFKHGTGHGVGCFLGVHEPPVRISCGLKGGNDIALEPGMIVSDEPGVYIEGSHGIRIENLMLCVPAGQNEHGTFYGFEFLTKIPIDLDAVDLSRMSSLDIERLNSYHRDVFKTLSPYFEGEELEWLARATREVPYGGI